jgi:VanZ family protein
LSLLLLIGLGTTAFALSLLPEETKQTLHTTGRLHSSLHFALFFLLGGLAIAASAKTGARVLLIAMAAMLGLAIEYSEKVHFNGGFELHDVITDLCGVLAGAAAGWLLLRRRG